MRAVVTALLLASAVGLAAADEWSECRACHTESKVHDLTHQAANDCVQCHNAEPLRHAASSTSAPAVISAPLPDSPTRLGAEANEMVRIPAGVFIMGSDARLPDEGPQHEVSLPAYWIDRYEVTNAQYKAYIDASGRRSPAHFRNRTYPAGKADHPVTFVTWYDADEYCRWAGKRLPSDQEWEKAARGSDGRMFPWGKEYDATRSNSPQHWVEQGLEGDTTPVGSFETGKSPYGLYDMSGNVWEWTASWYLPYPGNSHPSENYGEQYKVLKGGSWWDCSFYKCGISAPVFNRSFFLRGTRNKSFGFRCAKDAAAAEPPKVSLNQGKRE